MTTTLLNSVTLAEATYTGSQVSSAVEVRKQYGGPVVYIDYTKGDETSMQARVEFSDKDAPTGTDWYLPVTAGGAALDQIFTISATGKYRVFIPSKEASGPKIGELAVGDRAMRVSVKRTGGTAGGAGSVTVQVPHP